MRHGGLNKVVATGDIKGVSIRDQQKKRMMESGLTYEEHREDLFGKEHNHLNCLTCYMMVII